MTASIFLTLLSSVPCAGQTRAWTQSLYFGLSRAEDLGVYNDANLSAQVALFHVPDHYGWAPGGELGVLGLGEMGPPNEDVDRLVPDRSTQYGSAFVGIGLRRMARWGRHLRPYVGAGSAMHLLRTPGRFDSRNPSIWVRPGASVSVGVYGLAPGNLGIEARTHVVAAGKGEGVGGPLVIYSVLAGFNAP